MATSNDGTTKNNKKNNLKKLKDKNSSFREPKKKDKDKPKTTKFLQGG